jgi:hypothetical protein
MGATEPVVSSLSQTAATNYWILGRQTANLTHEQSLLQLPFRGNCMNWVLGHITTRRHEMLELVGAELIWTPEWQARYNTGSEPITSGADAMRFEQILADLGTAHERLLARLAVITMDEMNAPAKTVPQDPPPTVAQRLAGLLWHETYHVGQTEILRQLAGTNDKII